MVVTGDPTPAEDGQADSEQHNVIACTSVQSACLTEPRKLLLQLRGLLQDSARLGRDSRPARLHAATMRLVRAAE